jgi:hypothetical protein
VRLDHLLSKEPLTDERSVQLRGYWLIIFWHLLPPGRPLAVMTGRNPGAICVGTLCSFEGCECATFPHIGFAGAGGPAANRAAVGLDPNAAQALPGPSSNLENSIASASIVSASCKGHPVDA